MEFIDLHVHLQDYKEKFATDIVKKAQKLGLKKMVCAGTSSADWKQVASWAEHEPGLIVPAFGLHPWCVTKENPDWEEKLRGFLSTFPSSLVGETGLDGFRPDFSNQMESFERQIELAAELNRPLIIHAVKAFSHFRELWKKLPNKFMFHSFNASIEQLREILRHGGYVSFSASILKKRDCEKVITAVPSDRLLFESDGPYQPREKGEISSPFVIPKLLPVFAEIRGEDIEELARMVVRNSEEFIHV